MKKCSFLIVGVILFLMGCGNNGDETIDSTDAEFIAIVQLEQDLHIYNETASEPININDLELLSNDTVFSSSSKAWEVSFNYKDGLTNKTVATNAVAQYSVDPSGKITATTHSFE
ncbi:hypothetical protein [Rossellomorea marisflavi]|uniref:Lipoprotein n=1 Tax=Rossellomorea marisflavi TaxID=189381 RepID=A0A163LSP9_9BACI|nr:hypothetical protein [Rossellomorea marisflavi]KZE50891.1 hypothetical protein AV649_16055 [Rossellomorea marisflavi]MCM2603523.1 hypothetical protein [Rossellomorea marisflavi]USK93164.1 hypothetical protein LIT29_05285 [Rossellomorea marisflavi]